MLGGITLVPAGPDMRCMPLPSPIPPPSLPVPPRAPSIDEALPRAFEPAAIPPDIEDMPPQSGDRLKEGRDDPIGAVARDLVKESPEVPPILLGINPSNVPL
jgi:hypothetical protein